SRDEAGAMALMCGLGEGLARRQQPLHRFLANPPTGIQPHLLPIEKLITVAQHRARDRQAPESQRLLGLRLVLQARPAAAPPLIEFLLAAEQSPALQSAAARSVREAGDASLARRLLDRWQNFRINTRRELISALVRNAVLAAPLVDALEAGSVAM